MSESPCPSPISAIILAAGGSQRMGFPKLKLHLGGKSLLRRAAESALAAPVGEVVVVLGDGAADLSGDLPVDSRLRVVVNPRYAEGQSTSLQAGLAAVSGQTEAVVFLLADQPLPDSTVLDRVITAYRTSRPPLVLPLYQGVPGHPVLFARRLFAELSQVTGDQGGRSVVARHRLEAITVPVAWPPLPDVDTWEDYLQLTEVGYV